MGGGEWVVHAVGSSFLHAFMFIVAVKARPHHTKRALVVRKIITDCFPCMAQAALLRKSKWKQNRNQNKVQAEGEGEGS